MPEPISEVAEDEPLLIGCHEEPFSGRVYWVVNGARRWLPGQQYLDAHRLSFANVAWVPAEEIRLFRSFIDGGFAD